MKTGIETKAHAKFSASGAHRWLNCPGSIALTLKAPPPRESAYANEGTEAHSILEAVLKAHISGGKPFSVARTLEKTHDPEMVKHVVNAYKEILLLTNENSNMISETKVDLSFIHPGMFGTVDCALIEPFGSLTVIDFKYGAGIPVSPENNAQLIYYALGLAHLYGYDFSEVKLVVIQPRTESESGPVKTWATTIDELTAWANRFSKGVKEALKPNAEIIPYDPNLHHEDHCRFCPAAVICPGLKTRSLKEVKADFDDESGAMVLIEPKNLPIKNLGTIMTACDRLETWIGKVREHALHALEKGHPVEGWKLVQKRSTRKWTHPALAESDARQAFGNQAFSSPELLSPAQLEKATGNSDWVNSRTSSISSGVTVVPESDKRPSYNLFESDFKPLEEGATEKPKLKIDENAKKQIKQKRK